MKKHLYHSIVFGMTAAALTLFVSCGHKDAGPSATTESRVLTVGRSTITTDDLYPATIRGRQDVEVYAQITGKITRVAVSEGEHVRRGQTLFVIDQVPYRAALLTAQANLRAATANVASAQLTYDGKHELYKSKVGSLFDLRKASTALMAARAQQQQAIAAVTSARNDLSYTVVKSPSDGVVGEINLRVGALVSASATQPLTVVSDNSEMYVYFSLPESRLLELIRRYGSAARAVAEMPAARLKLSDGTMYNHEGRVVSLSGVMDSSTGAAQVRAVFANPDGLLHSGGAGNVVLSRTVSAAIVIPQSATYDLQDKVYAYRYQGGTIHATPISVTTVAEGSRYIVNSGLKPGDVIVTEGVGLLQDGQKIKVRR